MLPFTFSSDLGPQALQKRGPFSGPFSGPAIGNAYSAGSNPGATWRTQDFPSGDFFPESLASPPAPLGFLFHALCLPIGDADIIYPHDTPIRSIDMRYGDGVNMYMYTSV